MNKKNSGKNVEDPVPKVISVYLPERGEVERVAVNEAQVRGKPVPTGAMLRELVRMGIEAYWKLRPDPLKKAKKKPKAPGARIRSKAKSTHPVGRHKFE